ncbi:MAG: hypothetical protein V4523_07785 [Pseudomonadota bacterium]
MIRLLPILLLTACTPTLATCGNARAAAVLATAAMARICPIR